MIENLAIALWPVASWVLFASCKGIGVIALVLICRQLLAHWLSAQARHSLWFAVIACLAVPFGMHVDSNLLSSAVLSGSDATVDGVGNATVGASAQQPMLNRSGSGEVVSHHGTVIGPVNRINGQSNVGEANRAMRLWLVVVWLGVGLVLLSAALWNLLRYFRIRSVAQDVAPVSSRLFLECRAQLSVRRRIRLLQTTEIKSPAIFGWWSPTLLLPCDLPIQLNEKQLRYVFLHELTHVQRQDILFNWLMTLVQIVHWFNPFVWYALRSMRHDMEQACDAKVMAHLNPQERVDYGKTLIKLTDVFTRRIFSTHGVGVVASRSQLKERIKMISQFNPTRIRYSAIAVIALMTITSVAVTQPPSGSAIDSKASSTESDKSTNVVESQPVVRLAALTDNAIDQGKSRDEKSAKSMQKPTPALVAPAPKEDGSTDSKTQSDEAMVKDGILMPDLIEHVSSNIHKKIVVDPRVRGLVVTLVGQRLDQIDYSGLLTILRINGCMAFELNGYVNVVPVSDARAMPVPIVVEGHDYPEDQWVSMTMYLKNACASRLVPMLRPLLPQAGHMAAEPSSNSLLLMDTYANIKRISSMAKDLDARSTPDGQCGVKPVK